jgi:hypothetical protein
LETEAVSAVTADSSELRSLLAAKEAAELAGDLDAILATFHEEPVFDFLPIGRRLVGQDRVRLFYEQMVSDFVPRLESYSALNTFWSDTGMAMEEEIKLKADGGPPTVFRFVVVTGVRDGRLWGERLYGDERFFQLLLGKLYD